MYLFLFISLFITIALFLFSVQNSDLIQFSFLTLEYELSIALFATIMFAAGLITGIFISLPSIVRKSAALRKHKRKLSELEKDLSDMKTSQ